MSTRALWAVYVQSYDSDEGESYWKFVVGPFTKAKAEREAARLRREKVVSSFIVREYQGPRIRLYSKR